MPAKLQRPAVRPVAFPARVQKVSGHHPGSRRQRKGCPASRNRNPVPVILGGKRPWPVSHRRTRRQRQRLRNLLPLGFRGGCVDELMDHLPPTGALHQTKWFQPGGCSWREVLNGWVTRRDPSRDLSRLLLFHANSRRTGISPGKTTCSCSRTARRTARGLTMGPVTR